MDEQQRIQRYQELVKIGKDKNRSKILGEESSKPERSVRGETTHKLTTQEEIRVKNLNYIFRNSHEYLEYALCSAIISLYEG